MVAPISVRPTVLAAPLGIAFGVPASTTIGVPLVPLRGGNPYATLHLPYRGYYLPPAARYQMGLARATSGGRGSSSALGGSGVGGAGSAGNGGRSGSLDQLGKIMALAEAMRKGGTVGRALPDAFAELSGKQMSDVKLRATVAELIFRHAEFDAAKVIPSSGPWHDAVEIARTQLGRKTRGTRGVIEQKQFNFEAWKAGYVRALAAFGPELLEQDYIEGSAQQKKETAGPKGIEARAGSDREMLRLSLPEIRAQATKNALTRDEGSTRRRLGRAADARIRAKLQIAMALGVIAREDTEEGLRKSRAKNERGIFTVNDSLEGVVDRAVARLTSDEVQNIAQLRRNGDALGDLLREIVNTWKLIEEQRAREASKR